MMHHLQFLLFVTLIAGCGAADNMSLDYLQMNPPSEVDTELGVGDVFDVRVYDEDELSGTYRIDANGAIDFPLIGSIQLEGQTPSRAADLIKSSLIEGKFLKDPQVSIFVREYRSKRISVFGQVRKPGTFLYEDKMTVVHAITLAGGFTSIANKNNTTITRIVEKETKRIRVPVEDIGEGEASDIFIRPGDVIFVPERIF